MSEATGGRKPRTAPAAADTAPEEAAAAEVVEAEIVETPAEAPAAATPAEPTPESAAQPAPAQVIYVHTPPAPRRKGNRGIGALVAVVSGLVFTAALALVAAIINLVATGRFTFAFLGSPQFYLPTLFFVLAFVVLVLLANRAAWWAYILGSVLVGLAVYFGTIGALLLIGGVILKTPEEAALMFQSGLVNPVIIAAALLGREVSLWTGSIIARRGRKVKERNAQARSDWERDVAEKRAEGERAAAGAASAV